MGNSSSHEKSNNSQKGGDNFNDLQNKIQQLIKNTNTSQDTLNFNSSSDIDFDSVVNQTQNGGALRKIVNDDSRYENIMEYLKQAGGNNFDSFSSINESDLSMLKNVIRNTNNDVFSATSAESFIGGGNLSATSADSFNGLNIVNGGSLLLSATSDDIFIGGGNMSATSADSFNGLNIVNGGGNMSATSADSFNGLNIINGGATLLSATSADSFNIMNGGCGCSGNKNILLGSGNTELSATSSNPVDYNILMGGGDDSTDSTVSISKTTKSTDTDDSSSSSSSSDTNTSSSSSSSSNTNTESTDATKSTKSTVSSKSSIPPNSGFGKKKSRKNKHSEYISTGGSTNSSEIIIDSKFLYSDNNSFYGSDEISERYKSVKNRSMIN